MAFNDVSGCAFASPVRFARVGWKRYPWRNAMQPRYSGQPGLQGNAQIKIITSRALILVGVQ